MSLYSTIASFRLQIAFPVLPANRAPHKMRRRRGLYLRLGSCISHGLPGSLKRSLMVILGCAEIFTGLSAAPGRSPAENRSRCT